MASGFELSGVVHLVRPAGMRAGNLEELRRGLEAAGSRVLFYHAVQCRLRAPADEELPPDDFSAWVNGVVQDPETAERLSFAVQRAGNSAEPLRTALLQALGALPEAARAARAAPPEGAFEFLTVDTVRLPTGEMAGDAGQLMESLAQADACVWFFHLIEQPWFEPGTAPLVRWLRELGEPRLAGWLEEAASSGRAIDAARRAASARWRRRQIGRRMAEATRLTETERRDAGKKAVAGLVRRIKRAGEAP